MLGSTSVEVQSLVVRGHSSSRNGGFFNYKMCLQFLRHQIGLCLVNHVFFSSCGMFTGAVWLVNLKFAAKSAEVLPRWLCIISKEMFCKLRYPFLSYYAKVTTFIYNWSPNGRKKKGISHIFCWIHENFVDICLEIKLWDLRNVCFNRDN